MLKMEDFSTGGGSKNIVRSGSADYNREVKICQVLGKNMLEVLLKLGKFKHNGLLEEAQQVFQ